MKLNNKIALITGGGRGMAGVIALAFAREGAHCVVAARMQSQVDGVAEEVKSLGRKALSVQCDVANRESIQTYDREGHRSIWSNPIF